MLPKGKLPKKLLEEIVFKYLGVSDKDVVLGPSFGEDAAVLRINDKFLVVSCDPITGAEKWVGWLAVNASANDVAVQGARPRWFLSCILLPPDSNKSLVEEICKQMDYAARKLSMSIVGGHAEITPNLTRPIVIGSSAGITDGGYTASSKAGVGDAIILTKGVGIEGTAIIASDLRNHLKKNFSGVLLDRAESFFYKVSVVKEALIASKLEATAMHDPTEGGVAGALHELADASRVGFYIYRQKLFVDPITSRLCTFLNIDPLKLISSGTLLATARPENAEKIVRKLRRARIRAEIVGKIVHRSKGRRVEHVDGSVVDLPRPAHDDIWKVVAKGT